MKKILLFIIFFSSVAKSQPLFFEKVFGDSTDNCYAVALVQLPSGKLLAATNNYNFSGSNVIRLFGFDAAGNSLDTVSYSSPDPQYVNRMMLSADGFLYFAGYKYNGTPYSDGILIKADTNGAVIWNKSYGIANSNESFQGINMEGNFVFVSGYATNQNGSANSLYVMKLDTAGNISWDYAFNYPLNSTSDAVIPLPGGDIIASGDKLLGGGIYTNFIVRIDSGGNYVWDFDIPNQYNSGCKNDFMSASGDIYIVGESASSGNFLFDPTVTRIDTAHNIQWSNTYPGAVNATDAAMDMIEPLPENFLITGYGVNPANNSSDVFLMRIDSSGTEINRSYFGDTTFDIAYNLIRANSNAGCYIAGSTDRNGHNQGYLIYTGLLGIPTSIKDVINNEQNYNVGPNPCNDILTIVRKDSGLQNVCIALTDATGKYLIKDKTINHENIFHLSLGQFASGLYILNIKEGTKTFRQKIIVQHN